MPLERFTMRPARLFLIKGISRWQSQGTVNVGLHHLAEGVDREVLARGSLIDPDGGVVHKNVQFPEFTFDEAAEPPDALRRCQIELMKQNIGVSFIEFVAGGLSLSRVPGRQDDAGAAGGELAANLQADPFVTAGHDRYR